MAMKELRVDSSVVMNKAGDMQGIRGRLHNTMEEMKGKFTSLRSSWDSEASVVYDTQFTKIHVDLESMLLIVDEYVKDLNEVAQGYKTTEQNLQNAAQSLPGPFTTM